jgi:hypothetical protein
MSNLPMATVGGTSDYDMRKLDASASVPKWALKLARRIAKLEPGKAYAITVMMVGSTPVWTVQTTGEIENHPLDCKT